MVDASADASHHRYDVDGRSRRADRRPRLTATELARVGTTATNRHHEAMRMDVPPIQQMADATRTHSPRWRGLEAIHTCPRPPAFATTGDESRRSGAHARPGGVVQRHRGQDPRYVDEARDLDRYRAGFDAATRQTG